MKRLGKAVWLTIWVCAAIFGTSTRAQPTDQQVIDYVKNAWELTDLTDDVISQTLDTSYSGIPFKDYVSYFLVAPDILNPLASGDYTTAASKGADFAADQSISYLLEQAGLSGVFAPARLANWPIEHSLNLFRQAVQDATFKNQMKLYFAARAAGNSYSDIINLADSDVMSASPDILKNNRDTITKYEGWLAFEPSYLVGSVPGYTPAQFYDYAEQQWLAAKAYNNYAADQATVRDAFRASAVPQAPVITQQPQDAVIASGQNFTFTVVATGTGPFQYVWEKDGVPYAGPYGASFSATDAGQYAVTVFDAQSLSTRSRTATLTVNNGEPVAITAPAASATVSGITTVCASVSGATKVEFYLDGVRQFTDSGAPFAWTWSSALSVNGVHALTAKAYNGTMLLGASAAVSVTVNNTAPPPCDDPAEPNDSSLTATPLMFGVSSNGFICTPQDVDWFRVDVVTPGVLTFDLVVPATNDFDLELYGPDSAYVTGSYNSTGLPEHIAYNANVPGTYYVRVYGYPVGNGSYSSTSPYTISAGLVSGPVSILTPPLNRTVPAGASASFSVIATGAPSLAYQWQRDSADIPGATGPTYATSVLTLADNGAQFRVRVTNAFGSTLSAPATLTVTTANAITWTGAAGDGNWFNRTNWNPMIVPGGGDVVQLNSGSVNMPVNAQYAVINLAGGTLNSTFTLSGSMNWTGGTLSGDLTIGTGGVLTLSGAVDKTMNGAVLRNGGTVIWGGTGNLVMNNGSDIENLAGGLFDVQTDATMYWPGNGYAPTFNNAGTFRKSGGTGTTTLSSVSFNNVGALELLSGSLTVGSQFNQTGTCTITAGTLTLQSGGTCQGSFAVSASSSLQLAGGSFVLSSNVVFSGPGLSRVSNASVTFNGSYNLPNIQFDTGTTLLGTFTLTGTMSWTGGTLAGDMTIAPGGVLTLSGNADKTMNGAVLRNGGTVIWSGAGNLVMNNGSDIENLAGGLFDVQTDATMYWPGNGYAPTFNNAGTFRKSNSTGTTTISSVSFNNTGTVDVTSGTANFGSNNLRLQSGSQLTGTGRVIGSIVLNGANVASQNLELASGTTLTGTGTLSGTVYWTGGTLAGDFTLATNGVLMLSGNADKPMSNAVLRNGGTVIWGGAGNLVMNNGSDFENLAGGLLDVQTDGHTVYWPGNGYAPIFTNAGTLQVETGVLTFSSLSPKLNTGTTISGAGRVVGTLTLNGSVLLQNFQLAYGCTLAGTGTVQGTVSWTDGLVVADVTLATNCVLTLSGAVDKTMNGAVLRNGGTVIWGGTGNLVMNNGSDIENLAGGLFDVQTDATMYWPGNGYAPTFNNAGTFRKSGGTGTTTLSSVSFNNTGTVDVTSGTAYFSGGLNQTDGQTRLAGGSLSGGTFNFTGGVLLGTGVINAAVVNGAVVSPGSSLGMITVNGNYTQTASGMLQMELGGLTPGSGFDKMVVNGQATLAGTINVTLANGFTPSFSDAFPILTCSTRSGSFATINLPALPNALALTAQYSPNTMTLLTGNNTGNNATNVLAGLATATGAFELRYTGEAGHAYRLQASTNLADWVDVFTNTPVNGLIRFIDFDAKNMDRRFYRAVSP
ncbi:MAG TPA: Ig-like domain-containing protein [Verrucomicrobiota bacterium]|nr:Ig-like domain-containing protein [Verrucomicrobiota bacterium]